MYWKMFRDIDKNIITYEFPEDELVIDSDGEWMDEA